MLLKYMSIVDTCTQRVILERRRALSFASHFSPRYESCAIAHVHLVNKSRSEVLSRRGAAFSIMS